MKNKKLEQKILTSPSWKLRGCKFAYWVAEILRRPVEVSSEAPVADLYALNASVAIRTSVVPVSTMPAEFVRMGVEP